MGSRNFFKNFIIVLKVLLIIIIIILVTVAILIILVILWAMYTGVKPCLPSYTKASKAKF